MSFVTLLLIYYQRFSVESLTGETFPLASANIEDDAKLDVAAYGFCGIHHQKVFIDVKVFNPNASSYRGSSSSSLYHRKRKNRGSMSSAFVMWRCFTLLVYFWGICLIFVTSFSKD